MHWSKKSVLFCPTRPCLDKAMNHIGADLTVSLIQGCVGLFGLNLGQKGQDQGCRFVRLLLAEVDHYSPIGARVFSISASHPISRLPAPGTEWFEP
jgi:hypothetical protein